MIFFISTSAFCNEVIISNSQHHISKDTIGDFTEFSIEFISDYENDLKGEFPNVDFAQINVDVNKNSKLDPGLDRYYAPTKDSPCVGLLLSNISSKPCGSFESNAKIFNYFVKTEINPMPHPVVKYLIPTSELTNKTNNVSLVFKIYSAKRRYILS